MVAKQLDTEHFKTLSESLIHHLKAAIEMKRGSQDKVEFLHAQDNAVSALAKVMKFQHAAINLEETFQFWLSHLPIKNDLTEAKEANEFLADVLTEKPEMVVGPNGEYMSNFIALLKQNMKKDYMKPETITKFKTFVKNN
mmetsp:Transcript_34392/g.39776  ORF Transcript_34392/g.39776 Transcript_34392/m.39776 type:complete len:140 (-) Transcript_34392:58-477(-)